MDSPVSSESVLSPEAKIFVPTSTDAATSLMEIFSAPWCTMVLPSVHIEAPVWRPLEEPPLPGVVVDAQVRGGDAALAADCLLGPGEVGMEDGSSGQLESGVENDERGPCREVVALLILIDLAKTKRLQAASTAPKPRTEFWHNTVFDQNEFLNKFAIYLH